jgi:hypothetical protein
MTALVTIEPNDVLRAAPSTCLKRRDNWVDIQDTQQKTQAVRSRILRLGNTLF